MKIIRGTMSPGKNLLITGNPGVGKTTVLVWLAECLAEYHPVGFITKEIREGGVRKGFLLVSCSGQKRVLSHIDFSSPARVGKYKIDITGFEQFLSEIHLSDASTGLVIIDEIGKMECFSEIFRTSVLMLLDSDQPLIATIGKRGTPFMEAIKSRSDVRLVEVTIRNQESVKDDLLAAATAMVK
jgi:nucleoside-triphosphatase